MVRPSGDRIFALEDVDVGAADRRGGDADQRIERADVRDRLLVEHDAAGLDEDRRLSSWAWHSSGWFMRSVSASRYTMLNIAWLSMAGIDADQIKWRSLAVAQGCP